MIVTVVGRKVNYGDPVMLGVEDDQNVELIAFRGLPMFSEGQLVTFQWRRADQTAGNVVMLTLSDGLYTFVVTEDITQFGGVNIEAFIEVISGEKRWSTFKFTVTVAPRPDVESNVTQPTPSLFEQLLAEIAQHNADMTVALQKVGVASVSAETLDAGDAATVAHAQTVDGMALTFGIPRGATGQQGERGEQGEPGEVTNAQLAAAIAPLNSQVSAFAAAQTICNVKSRGAVGEAQYHHRFGIRKDVDASKEFSGRFWVGHFSSLAVMEYHELYQGDPSSESVRLYQVVDDTATIVGDQIRMRDVHPGPLYVPAVGDVVVQYEAADPDLSVYATDDSAAFEDAINASGGYLFLPAGDYAIGALTARKIRGISGPGRIWINEWNGGELFYLVTGLSDLLYYAGYGWIDEKHFHDEAWKAMHWVSDVVQANGWNGTGDFTGTFSPHAAEAYRFDADRESINVWFVVQPAVPEAAFPDEITVCVSKEISSFISLAGNPKWQRASTSDVAASMFNEVWVGDENTALPESAWKDCGDSVEITVPKAMFFYHSTDENDGEAVTEFVLHGWCITPTPIDFAETPVEFSFGYGKVWLKDAAHDNLLLFGTGGDMRAHWEPGLTHEYDIHEAYNSRLVYLTTTPREMVSYNVSDELFDVYMNAGMIQNALNLQKVGVASSIDYNTVQNIPGKMQRTFEIVPEQIISFVTGTNVLLNERPSGWFFWTPGYLYRLTINGAAYDVKPQEDGTLPGFGGLYWIWVNASNQIMISIETGGSCVVKLEEYDVSQLDRAMLPDDVLSETSIQNGTVSISYEDLHDVPCKYKRTKILIGAQDFTLPTGNSAIATFPANWYGWEDGKIYELTINGAVYRAMPTGDGGINPFGPWTIWAVGGSFMIYAEAGTHAISLDEYELVRLNSVMLPAISYDTLKDTPCKAVMTTLIPETTVDLIVGENQIGTLPISWSEGENRIYRLSMGASVFTYQYDSANSTFVSEDSGAPGIWQTGYECYVWPSEAETGIAVKLEAVDYAKLDYGMLPDALVAQMNDLVSRISELENQIAAMSGS